MNNKTKKRNFLFNWHQSTKCATLILVCAFIGDIYIFERKYKSDKSALSHTDSEQHQQPSLSTSDSADTMISAERMLRKGLSLQVALALGCKGETSPCAGDSKGGKKPPLRVQSGALLRLQG